MLGEHKAKTFAQTALNNSSTLRTQIDLTLAGKVPGALNPQFREERERTETGVAAVDAVLRGGLPVGAISEIVGGQCCGRTTLAISSLATIMQAGQVCAWVDVADALDPETAAAGGVDFTHLLWVRCGGGTRSAGAVGCGPDGALDRVPGTGSRAAPMGVPVGQGSCGSPHPQSEGKGLPKAIEALLRAYPERHPEAHVRSDTEREQARNKALLPLRRRDKSIGTPSMANRSAGAGRMASSPVPPEREEQVPTDRLPARRGENLRMQVPNGKQAWEPHCVKGQRPEQKFSKSRRATAPAPWRALDQALRATDLLLQAGGFGAIVLDLGSTPAEMVWRIPLATWFRFRAAAERSRVSLLLLTQHPCARSSAELVLTMAPSELKVRRRVVTGVGYRAEVDRQRFSPAPERVVSIRKPPQSEKIASWIGQAAWIRGQRA